MQIGRLIHGTTNATSRENKQYAGEFGTLFFFRVTPGQGYGSFTKPLREQHGLSAFYNEVLRAVSGLTRPEVPGERRKIYNQD
jgi:hypothetical protein